MTSRKKGKKTKGTTVDWTEFVNTTSAPVKSSTSWADAPDDDYEGGGYMSKNNKEPVVLPTAPRAAREPGVDEENIPSNGPYVAYVSNLSYDILEDDLTEFFAGLEVANMRLPRDSTKPRGYGYVEFSDRQSLIEALGKSNSMIKQRRVRIEVSNSSNDERRGGRMGMGRDGNRRDQYDDPERTSGDWRSRPKEEPSGGRDDRFRGRGGGGRDGGGREGGRDGGREGGGFENRYRRDEREPSDAVDTKPGSWRDGERSTSSFSERRGYKDDDRRGGFRSDERRGGGGFRDDERRGGGGFRDDERRGGFRDEERRGGGGGFRDDERRAGFRDDERRGGNDERRGFRDDGEREKEREWSRDRNTSSFGPRRDDARREEAPSTERPKLNLQPRTKPVEAIVQEEEIIEEAVKEEEEEEEEAPARAPVRAADIFGSAKPVDTTAREREIEERLAKAEKPKSEDGEGKGTWGKRNGEGRSDREREKPRPTWRSDEDRGRQSDRYEKRYDNRGPTSGRSDNRGESRGDSGGPPSSRQGIGSSRTGGRGHDSRGPPERERRDRERDRDSYKDDPPMPKATDEQAPNFAASNKYSILPEDVDPDNIDA